MAALTTMVAAAAVGIGAASALSARNDRRDAERRARQEAERQETRAREAAALKGPDMQDTRVKMGAGDSTARSGSSSGKQQAAASRNTTTGVDDKRLFGGASASRIGGL